MASLEPRGVVPSLCATGEVEDELHFLYNCPAYGDLRRDFHSIFEDNKDLKDLKSFLILTCKMSMQ